MNRNDDNDSGSGRRERAPRDRDASDRPSDRPSRPTSGRGGDRTDRGDHGDRNERGDRMGRGENGGRGGDRGERGGDRGERGGDRGGRGGDRGGRDRDGHGPRGGGRGDRGGDRGGRGGRDRDGGGHGGPGGRPGRGDGGGHRASPEAIGGPRERAHDRPFDHEAGPSGGASRGGDDGPERGVAPHERVIVLPGDRIGDRRAVPGQGAARVGEHVVALTPGLLQTMGERVSVIPMNGAYDPRPGDMVVGIIHEANPGNWIVDIKAPWLAPMHVSEVPWRVDFGETTQYLKPGDAILCKVLFVDEQKKVQVTLKDRNLSKLEGGELMEVSPVKVARIIGKNGSMLNTLKEYVACWLVVGQNGRIWLNGEPKEVILARKAIGMIAREAHLAGVSDRVKAFLEKERPGGVDAGIVLERKAARPAAEEKPADAGEEPEAKADGEEE